MGDYRLRRNCGICGALFFFFCTLSFGGNVWEVGPNRQFTQIQDAISNPAVQENDLILVDPLPSGQCYNSIWVTVPISILSSTRDHQSGDWEQYCLSQTANYPALTFLNITDGQVATVFDARIEMHTGQSHAILGVNNAGTIRLHHVTVSATQDFGWSQSAAVSFQNDVSSNNPSNGNGAVWLDQVKILSNHHKAQRILHSAIPSSIANNDGVSALEAWNTRVYVYKSTFEAFDQFQNSGGNAGDGVRLIQTHRNRSFYYSHGEVISLGGNSTGGIGGNGLHLVFEPNVPAPAYTTCGWGKVYLGGGGSLWGLDVSQNGNTASSGSPGANAGMVECIAELATETRIHESSPTGPVTYRLSIGQNYEGEVVSRDPLLPSQFHFWVGKSEWGNIPRVGEGVLMSNPEIRMWQGYRQIQVPQNHELVGKQLTIQALSFILGNTNGVSFSRPSMIVITP